MKPSRFGVLVIETATWRPLLLTCDWATGTHRYGHRWATSAQRFFRNKTRFAILLTYVCQLLPSRWMEIWPVSSHVIWRFGTFFIFPYIGNAIIPIDELIFFRGVAQPPTSMLYGQYGWCSSSTLRDALLGVLTGWSLRDPGEDSGFSEQHLLQVVVVQF